MNQYGSRALRHWEQHRRTALSELSDPTVFFTELGEEILTRIDALCGPAEAAQRATLNAMGYLERVGRLNAIKASAEETAMHELVYALPMETPLTGLSAEQLQERAQAVGGTIVEGRLVPADKTHLWWEMFQEVQSGEDLAPGHGKLMGLELGNWLEETPEREALGWHLEDLALAE